MLRRCKSRENASLKFGLISGLILLLSWSAQSAIAQQSAEDKARKLHDIAVNAQNEEEYEFAKKKWQELLDTCLLYTSPSPRDQRGSRMPSSA